MYQRNALRRRGQLVDVLGSARARRGSRSAETSLFPTLYPLCSTTNPLVVHRALLHVEPGHRREGDVSGGEPTVLVVLGVEPLGVGGIELVLERGRVPDRELHHAPLAGKIAKLRRSGRPRGGTRLEPRVRARGGAATQSTPASSLTGKATAHERGSRTPSSPPCRRRTRGAGGSCRRRQTPSRGSGTRADDPCRRNRGRGAPCGGGSCRRRRPIGRPPLSTRRWIGRGASI